jgi:hypothetical protein
MVAGGHRNTGSCKDDFAGVAVEEAAGEVPAERKGSVQPDLVAPRGEATVQADAIEQQSADHRPTRCFGGSQYLGNGGGVVLNLVGVSD